MWFAPRARALLAVLFAGVCSMQAQPFVTLLSPAAGAVDITQRPDIIVLAPGPIDAASITSRWPNAEPSGWRSDEPTLLLLRAADARQHPRSAWANHAIRVRYAQIDPRMLRMTVGTLQPGTEYVAILQRLTVDGGTHLLPLEFTFTTRHDVPRLRTHSLVGVDAVGCKDRIDLQFTTPISTLPESIDRYVRVSASSADVAYTIVTHDKGQGITLVPATHWPAGQILRVDVTLDKATGEHLDQHRIEVPVRGAGRLRVQGRSNDGSPVPDTVQKMLAANNVVAVLGTTYHVQCPPWPTTTWRFVRWESTSVASLHGVEEPHAQWTPSCEDLQRELVVGAVLERVDTLKVPLTIDDGTVEVYDIDGALLDVFDADDTLTLTATTPHVMLHAMAAAGSVFGQWSAAGTSLHGRTAPAQLASIATLHPGTTHTMVSAPVVPRFMPPTGNERYRLRGKVEDVDPTAGVAADQSVVWTTPTEYEDIQSTTKLLCVAATDCWEILGYMSVNGRTMYKLPQREACVQEQLLDPEHVVTFLVRRIPLQLRVELALLETDNQDDLIVDKHPHPDVRITAERGHTVGATTVWVPLGERLCRNPREVARATWNVACGDNIRLRIRDAASRGETWKFFAAVTNYVQPAGGNRVGDALEFTLVADSDRAVFDAEDCSGRVLPRKELRLRACFKAELGIEALGVRMRVGGATNRTAARFEQRWLDPLVYYDRFDDEPHGGRQLEYIGRIGTDIKVRFTRPVDIRTIEAGGITMDSYGNIDPLQVGRTGMDFLTATSAEGNTSYEPLDGGPITTIVFRAFKPGTTPRKHATYLGSINLTCGATITSLRGGRLRSSANFSLNTMELPAFGVQLRSVGLSYDGDWDLWPFVMYGEIYHAMYGGVLAADKALHTEYGFRRLPPCSVQQGSIPDDCTYEQSDDDPPMNFGDLLQYMEPNWLDRADMSFTHIMTYDEDCKDDPGCLVGEIQTIINQLRDQITGTPPGPGAGADWRSIVNTLIRGGFDLINALMEPDDQDEYLGEHTMLEGAGTMWGVTPAGFSTGYGKHTTYIYRPRFFVRTAVLY